MRHDLERDAARLPGRVMPVSESQQFCEHLLSCPECPGTRSSRVAEARSLAAIGRTVAPPGLRDGVDGLVEADSFGGSAAATAWPLRLRRRWSLPACVPLAAAAVVALILTSAAETPEPPSLRAAVADLGLDGCAYRDPAGRRAVLYLSDKRFPEAPRAELLVGPDGPRVAHRGDVVVLWARVPLALLVVGQDDELGRSVGSALGVL